MDRIQLAHLEEADLPEVAFDPRFKILADSAPVYLWMAAPDSRCIFFNDQWLQFTGRTMEQEIGYGWAEGLHHEDLQRCMDTYLAHFSKREEFEMVYRLRRNDGVYRWILDRGKPFYEIDGSFAGYIGSCTDITEKVLIEKNLQRYTEELERVSQLKSDFITMVTHELRTPLTTLMEGINLVMEGVDGPLNEAQGYTLSIVKKNIVRLGRLVTNVLDFQKLESNTMHLHIAFADLTHIVSEFSDLMRFEVEKKKLQFMVDLPPESLFVPCDSDRIKQVLFNLMANAIKFTDAPGSIGLKLDSDHEKVWIEVRDSGFGIPEADQKKIFEMFHQAGGPARSKTGGFGVGLTICKKIMELHHGAIRVESQPGRGSRFIIELPLHPKL